MIIEMLPVGMIQANCYIVGCEETHQAVLIDPGGEAPRLLQTIQELGVDLTHILLTHAHFDHMAGANEISQATGLPVEVHPDDLPLLKSGGGAALFGLPNPPIPSETQLLTPGEKISIGKNTLHVLYTPGHSLGHVSFHEPDEKVVFDGDVLFASGIGRTDLPGGSYETLKQSIEKLLQLPDDTRVYSGHGPVTTIGQEKVSNPWF